MVRPCNPRPSYLMHQASGRARVRIDGVDIYLGKYNSPESWQKYHEIVAKYPTPQSRIILVHDEQEICVAELAAKYVAYADEYYRNNRDEKYRISAAIRPLVELYGSTPVAKFSPKKLQAVRQHVIGTGHARDGKPLSRKYVNQLTGVIKRVFKWGVSDELVPVAVHQALGTVSGLKKGRTPEVREPARVKPVDPEHIPPVLKEVSPQIGAMIQLQDLTGMRPDEVTIMRPSKLDTSGSDVWVYTIDGRFDCDNESGLGSKTDWLEDVDSKQILLGPRARAIIRPWLANRGPNVFLFSPKEVAQRYGWHNPSRPPRDHYDDETYGRAVRRACLRARVPIWTPGRLRHNAATRIRKLHGAEAARLVLGHRHLSTTEIYAERDFQKCRDIVKETG